MAAGPPPIARPPTRELAFGDACFAVNLQIRPPDDTRVRLDDLRTRMAEGTGLAMQVAPAGTLHLTVFSIVYVRAVYPSGPEAVWTDLRQPVDAALRKLSGTTPPFTLDFVRAGLRGDAVLVEADPDPRLEAIRDRVEAAIDGIARLTQPVAAPRFRPLADWLGEPVLAWPVHELRLVVETRYPALDESPAGRYPLTGR